MAKMHAVERAYGEHAGAMSGPNIMQSAYKFQKLRQGLKTGHYI